MLCGSGLLWRGIQSLLEQDSRLRIVGIADDPKHARELIQQHSPDIIIIDETHFSPDDVQAQFHQLFESRSVVVTLHDCDNRIRIHHVEERTLSSPQELIDALMA